MNKRLIFFCTLGYLLNGVTARASWNEQYSWRPDKRIAPSNTQFRSYGTRIRYAMFRQLYGQSAADSFYRVTRENFYTDFLPLTGGTLTGLLEGTAAAFSGNFLVSGTSTFDLANFSNAITISRASTAGASLVINRTSASYAATTLYQDNASSRWAVGTDGDGTADFKFYNHATGNYSFKIGYSTDLATFSGSAVFGGSVTGGNASFALGNFSNAVTVSRASTAGASFVINRTSASYAATTLYQDNASSRWTVGTDGDGSADFKFYDHATGNYSLKLGYGTDLATFTGGASFAGNVGIGTTSPAEKLSVNGNVSAKKIIVTQTGWSDYVFNDDYALRPLSQVAQYIKKYKHLPDIPSAKIVMQTGINVGDNQALLLKKIEELTLYVIELQQQVDALKHKINIK